MSTVEAVNTAFPIAHLFSGIGGPHRVTLAAVGKKGSLSRVSSSCLTIEGRRREGRSGSTRKPPGSCLRY